MLQGLLESTALQVKAHVEELLGKGLRLVSVGVCVLYVFVRDGRISCINAMHVFFPRDIRRLLTATTCE